MNTTTAAIRQHLACGFEPPIAGAVPWSGPGYKGSRLTTCPGYTTRLPQVVEAARASTWKADLRTFFGGDEPTRALVYAIDTFEDESNVCDRWWLKEDSK